MAYTPTTWANGDTIDATKLNKMEQGIANAGAAMIVNLTAAQGQADKTFAEIFDALRGGTPVYLKFPDPGANWGSQYVAFANLLPVIFAFKYDTQFRVYATLPAKFGDNSYSFLGSPGVYVMSAGTASSYPSYLRHVYANPDTAVVVSANIV